MRCPAPALAAAFVVSASIVAQAGPRSLLPAEGPWTVTVDRPWRAEGTVADAAVRLRIRAEEPLLGRLRLGASVSVDVVVPDGVSTIELRCRHRHGEAPIVTVLDDGVVRYADRVVEGDAQDGPPPAFERLPGLRHVFDAAATPDLSAGRFALLVRFRTEGDGTLVAKAPAAGKWAPHGKTLFVRGGRLVYDIGWVGELGGGPSVDDGRWHTAALTHVGAAAVLFVDGVEVGRRAAHASEDGGEHVLKIGATSANFGGGLTDGEVASVRVYPRPLDVDTARRLSTGEEVAAVGPVLSWDASMPSNVPADRRGEPVEHEVVLEVDTGRGALEAAVAIPLGDVDHAAEIRRLDAAALARGERLYRGMCAVCHGQDGETTVHPTARAFSAARLENGSDPYALYRTLTEGFRTMPAQTWMTPSQRYDVIHFLREEFLKRRNPAQYFAVTAAWLDELPPPAPRAPDAAFAASDADDLPLRDFGPALSCQIGESVPAGLAVRLPHDVTVGYDLHRMASVGAWRGAFLDLAETQHYQQRGEGIGRPGAEPWGWTRIWGPVLDDAEKPDRGPVPAPAFERRGHFVHGRRIVLDYAVRGRRVFESPSAVQVGEETALVHHLRVAPGQGAVAWRAFGQSSVEVSPAVRACPDGDGFAVLGVLGGGTRWTDDGFEVQTDREAVVVAVRARVDSVDARDAFAGWLALNGAALVKDPTVWTKGGAPLWGETLTTRGERGEPRGAYAVDTLALPNDNPWNAWLRTSALDFFADGRAAVATLGGDVWIVDGIDADLRGLRWRRFASGLFEPLGLAIVDGAVHVTCRDGVLRLDDLDGDGEADRYAVVHADGDVTPSFHAFNFDLQVDADGYLHYVKSGLYTRFDIPGAVVRIPPAERRAAGEAARYVATGFRTPNGMGILPDGTLTVSDNQGQWVPASKVSRIRDGGFYGVFQRGSGDRETFDLPIVWLPQEVDSSSGGQLWVDDPRCGPLAGHLLHTSFGKGQAYVLRQQRIGDAWQASCVTLPFQFDAGVQRLRTNPRDGQVYLVGLSGWQGPPDGADGALQRLRFVPAAEVTTLLGAETTADGVELVFDRPVLAPDRGAFAVERWNYRWTGAYGSAKWSVTDPERRGTDPVEVVAARLAADPRRLRLELADWRPADTVRIEVRVAAADGTRIDDAVHLTVHAIPGS